MKKFIPSFTLLTIALIAAALYMYCRKGPNSILTQDQSTTVTHEVIEMADNISKDVSKDGPAAWVHYFEQTPQFFMASDGQLVFSNSTTATAFIQNTLVKIYRSINLTWNDIRIDPLTADIATMAAGFHETIADSSGKQINTTGYFTGTAQKLNNRWQLRNAHWSIAIAKK